MHRHKSSGFVFDRTESDEIICPECLEELITGKAEGKEFIKGHLVHLALTRVPVNTRTSMEVERSMTTRKEDAASIVTDEIAEELEEEAKAIGKSLATDGDPMVVIKAEDEPEVEEKREKPSDYKEDDDEEEEDDKKKKKKEMKEDKSETGKIDSVLHLLEELKADLAVEPEPVHPLDPAISELKSVYDDAVKMENTEEALMAVNEPYEALVSVIQNNLSKEEVAEVSEGNAEISQLKSFMVEQFGLMQSQISALQSQPQQVLPEGTPPPVVPERRSVTMNNPELFAKPQVEQSETPKLTATVRRSVGLE
jgi:hypothetical protein